MLSDRDRVTLHEIQAQFLADDPGFVQTFNTLLPPPAGTGGSRTRDAVTPHTPVEQQRRHRMVLMWIAALLCVSLPAVAGPTGGGLLLVIIAVVALVVTIRTDVGTGVSGPWT